MIGNLGTFFWKLRRFRCVGVVIGNNAAVFRKVSDVAIIDEDRRKNEPTVIAADLPVIVVAVDTAAQLANL